MKAIELAAVPNGMPTRETFRLVEAPDADCPEGGVLVRTAWISVDPYLRGRISGVKSYIDPILVGQRMESSAVGQVLESRAEGFTAGDWVTGLWPWQELAAPPVRTLRKLDPQQAPVSTALGILGMPGMTAYFGLLDICQPKAGETLFVTGAAGAVGATVGQIGKILGLRVVGTAGSAAKVDHLYRLGFDAAFDYHTDRDPLDLLTEYCPNGIDCFFENVGGKLSDAIFSRMNPFGRIAICGQISQYNSMAPELAPRPFTTILTRQLRVEGFIVSRFAPRFAEGRAQMAQWLKAGQVKFEETVYEGIEAAPDAFIGLFRGENTGKALVRL
jgi:NADPH-dependent curcumin reductase CurA